MMEKEQIKKFFEEIELAKGIANMRKFEQDIMIPEIIKAKKEVIIECLDKIDKINISNVNLKRLTGTLAGSYVCGIDDVKKILKHHLSTFSEKEKAT